MAKKKQELTEDEKQKLINYEKELQKYILDRYDKLIKTSYITNLFYIGAGRSLQYELETKKMILEKIDFCKRMMQMSYSDEKARIFDDKIRKHYISIINNTFTALLEHIEKVEKIYKMEVAKLSDILDQETVPSNVNAVDFKFVENEFKDRMKNFSFGGKM